MGRFERSIRICTASLRTVFSDRRLLLLPFYSLLGMGLWLAALIPLVVAGHAASTRGTMNFFYAVAFVLAWVGVTFVGAFFNTALCTAVLGRFDARPMAPGDAIRATLPRAHTILGWAVIASTVGIVLYLLSRKGGILGVILRAIGAAAWAFATFFVIPILATRDVSPVGAIRESSGLFKRTWGEQVLGGLGISIAFWPAWILLVVLSIGVGALLSPWVGLALGVVLAVLVICAQTAVQNVFLAAVYRWATSGSMPPGFGRLDPGAFFRQSDEWAPPPPGPGSGPHRPHGW